MSCFLFVAAAMLIFNGHEVCTFSSILGILEIIFLMFSWDPGNIGDLILVSWDPGSTGKLSLQHSLCPWTCYPKPEPNPKPKPISLLGPGPGKSGHAVNPRPRPGGWDPEPQTHWGTAPRRPSLVFFGAVSGPASYLLLLCFIISFPVSSCPLFFNLLNPV